MLSRYTAFRFVKVMESGRTNPLLLDCEAVDEQREHRKFIVKAPGLPEVSDYELFVETLSYLLAGDLGVETPYAALIDIEQEFVDVVNPILKQSNISISAGLGFGSELIAPAVTATTYRDLRPEQIQPAISIFCFDLLVQNPDRILRNPNCLISGGQFIAFDFNMAFSFLLLLGKMYEPWEVSKHQIQEGHLFSAALKGRNLDFRPFIDTVRRLTPSRVDEILAAVPFCDGKWDDKVRSHVISIIENVDKLELEFARCLR